MAFLTQGAFIVFAFAETRLTMLAMMTVNISAIQ
jgi:hypothetical protein